MSTCGQTAPSIQNRIILPRSVTHHNYLSFSIAALYVSSSNHPLILKILRLGLWHTEQSTGYTIEKSETQTLVSV